MDQNNPEINKLASASSFDAIDKCADVVLKTAALLGVSTVVVSLCRVTWLCSEGIFLRVATIFGALVAVGIFAIALALITSFFGDYRNVKLSSSNLKTSARNISIFAIMAMIESSFFVIGWYSFTSGNDNIICT